MRNQDTDTNCSITPDWSGCWKGNITRQDIGQPSYSRSGSSQPTVNKNNTDSNNSIDSESTVKDDIYKILNSIEAPKKTIVKDSVKNDFGTYDIHLECKKSDLKYYLEHARDWSNIETRDKYFCDNAPAMQQPTSYTVLNDGAQFQYATYVTYEGIAYKDYVDTEFQGLSTPSFIFIVCIVILIMYGFLNFGFIKRAK